MLSFSAASLRALLLGVLVAPLAAQVEGLHPANFAGSTLEVAPEGRAVEFEADGVGRLYWLASDVTGQQTLLVSDDGREAKSPFGAFRATRGLLCADPSRGLVWLLDRGRDSTRLYTLHPSMPPSLRGTLGIRQPSAISFDERGRLWVTSSDEKGSALHVCEGLDGTDPRPLPWRQVVRLPIRPERLLALNDGKLLLADGASVWLTDQNGARPRQIFLLPTPGGEGRSEIRGLVASPFEAIGTGFFVLAVRIDGQGVAQGASAWFGRDGAVPTGPFAEKEVQPISGQDLEMLGVRSHPESGMHFASISVFAPEERTRFDRVTQRSDLELPGRLEAKLERGELVVRLIARPGMERAILLYTGVPASRGHWRGLPVRVDPKVRGVRILRDGFDDFPGVPGWQTDSLGVAELRMPWPHGATQPFWLHALVDDERAVNGRFLVASTLVRVATDLASPAPIVPPVGIARPR